MSGAGRQVTRPGLESWPSGGAPSGPDIHAVNGVARRSVADERMGVGRFRELFGYLPLTLGGALPLMETVDPPGGSPQLGLECHA
jgi:hypothetical protein